MNENSLQTDRYESLLKMPLKLQMQNVGAEVARMIRFKKEGKMNRAIARATAASQMLEVMKQDKLRAKEFDFMAEEIMDYVSENPQYDPDEVRLLHQYDIFL